MVDGVPMVFFSYHGLLEEIQKDSLFTEPQGLTGDPKSNPNSGKN